MDQARDEQPNRAQVGAEAQAGSVADDLGVGCGGWALGAGRGVADGGGGAAGDWLGAGDAVDDFAGGVFQAFLAAVFAAERPRRRASTGKTKLLRIGALNSYAVDVSGAGDSLLITSSMALACGADIWEAACLGSLSAAVQVGRVGNIPLKAKELFHYIQ